MASGIHPLKRWLFDRQETAAAFAERMGVAQSHLSGILARKKQPSLALAIRLSQATSGKVPVEAFGATSERYVGRPIRRLS